MSTWMSGTPAASTAAMARATHSASAPFAYDSITRPTTLSCRPGATALMARRNDSWVRSTSSRFSSETSPARNVALVSPWTPPM